MKTVIHYYEFDLDDPAQREPYHQLSTRLKGDGRGHRMHSFDPKREHAAGSWLSDQRNISKPITLEPEHLFENQWNSDLGRVFDWFEAYIGDTTHARLQKRGHWLEFTPEMLEIRRNTLKCGYTGQQFPASCGFVFNETAQALGSPYLKESELHLVRLLSIDKEFKVRRQPLTAAERDYLLPKYITAQTEGADTRAGQDKAKLRAEYIAAYEKTERLAKIERDGFLWLMDHGVPTENVIFYDHTGRFSFGWRSPYSASVASKLVSVLAQFPFPYDIAGEKEPAAAAK